MNSNFSYLTQSLRDAGFGTSLNTQLFSQLQKGIPRFTILYQERENPGLEVKLGFARWREQPFYYFKKFHVRLRVPATSRVRERDFFFGRKRDPTVTLREAINLLKGQSVYKEKLFSQDIPGEYSALITLEFNKTDGMGNYSFGYHKIKKHSRITLRKKSIHQMI